MGTLFSADVDPRHGSLLVDVLLALEKIRAIAFCDCSYH